MNVKRSSASSGQKQVPESVLRAERDVDVARKAAKLAKQNLKRAKKAAKAAKKRLKAAKKKFKVARKESRRNKRKETPQKKPSALRQTARESSLHRRKPVQVRGPSKPSETVASRVAPAPIQSQEIPLTQTATATAALPNPDHTPDSSSQNP